MYGIIFGGDWIKETAFSAPSFEKIEIIKPFKTKAEAFKYALWNLGATRKECKVAEILEDINS